MEMQSKQQTTGNGGLTAAEAAAAVELAELGPSRKSGQQAPLALLYDLDLPLTVELGRTRMTVNEVLGLGRGSVVQLDRLVGEPVDIYVGDRKFAEAEVVVLGEQFGVRINRIVSPALPEDRAS